MSDLMDNMISYREVYEDPLDTVLEKLSYLVHSGRRLSTFSIRQTFLALRNRNIELTEKEGRLRNSSVLPDQIDQAVEWIQHSPPWDDLTAFLIIQDFMERDDMYTEEEGILLQYHILHHIYSTNEMNLLLNNVEEHISIPMVETDFYMLTIMYEADHKNDMPIYDDRTCFRNICDVWLHLVYHDGCWKERYQQLLKHFTPFIQGNHACFLLLAIEDCFLRLPNGIVRTTLEETVLETRLEE